MVESMIKGVNFIWVANVWLSLKLWSVWSMFVRFSFRTQIWQDKMYENMSIRDCPKFFYCPYIVLLLFVSYEQCPNLNLIRSMSFRITYRTWHECIFRSVWSGPFTPVYNSSGQCLSYAIGLFVRGEFLRGRRFRFDVDIRWNIYWAVHIKSWISI